MKIRRIAELLDAQVLCGEENLDGEVQSACGCDMMSDVLAFVKEQAVLITGLCNPQVMRTAEMLDLMCVAFIRGKKPTEEMVEMAKEEGMVVLVSNFGMFNACGKLYSAGAHSGCI